VLKRMGKQQRGGQWIGILTDNPGPCTGATGRRVRCGNCFWTSSQLFVPFTAKGARLARRASQAVTDLSESRK
jgi:hypothetical protein